MSTYDLYKNKSYSLRLPNDLRMKFEYIAKEKGYSKTSHAYKDLIEKYVREYEKQNGAVEV